MANEAGVVKSVTGGSVIALNNATGEVRNLSVGDIVYQNEKIITDSSDSKVTITQTDGKDITLIGKDTLTLDQDSNNNETVADISALQQAILKGTDLNALEETAAGGPQAGGNGGDGVSLTSTSFAEGGHISNINANVGSIDALSLAAGGDNSFGVSGGSAVGAGTGTGTTGPALPAGSIKIPLSAYVGESTSSRLLASFYNSIPNGYHVYRHTDGRDYLTPDDPTTPSAFQHKDGWYVSNDGKLAIGQDDAKDLAVTSTAKASNYPDDGSVAKIVNPNPNLKVFGSDTSNDIIIDDTHINLVKSGVGTDDVKFLNNATVDWMSSGSSADRVELPNGSSVNNTIIVTEGGEDVVNIDATSFNGSTVNTGADNDTVNINTNITATAQSNIVTEDGSDTINIKSGITLTNVNVDMGAGKDTIKINDGKLNSTDRIIFKGSTLSTGSDTAADDNDVITISNATFMESSPGKYSNVYTKNGDDIVTVKDGTIFQDNSLITTGRGNDKVYLESSVQFNKGTVWADDGDDEIHINGAEFNGPRGIGGVSGGAGNDKIFINDGTKFTGGSILGDFGATLDPTNGPGNDQITISGARTELNNVNIDTGDANVNADGGAKDTVKIEDAKLRNTNITSGKGDDEITITGNANLTGGFNKGGSGDDIITVSGNAILNGTYLEGEQGNDTITISGNVKAKGGNFSTGAGADDKIEIKDNAELDGTTLQFEGGKSTDKATLNVTGNAVLKDVSIKADSSLGEQYMNFHQSGEAKVKSLMGSQNKDVIDIAGDFTYTNVGNNLQTYGGDDEIKMHGGATVKVKADMGDGNDKLTIENANFKNDSFVNMGKGEDKVYINAGANLNDVQIDGGNGNDEININGGILTKTEIDTGRGVVDSEGKGGDTVNIRGGKFSGTQIWLGNNYSGGKNTVNIDNKASGQFFGDQYTNLNNGEYKTFIQAWYNANAKDTVNIKDGAVVKNATIALHGNEDEINIAKGATVEHSRLITGDQNDTVTINGDVSNTHIHLGFHKDTLKIGDGVTITGNKALDANIYMDSGDTRDSSTFGNDIVKIGNGVTLKNGVGINGGHLGDDIKIGDNLTLDGKAGIYGDWGNDGVAQSKTTDGNDIITIGDKLKMTNGSIISGGGGDDIISIGKNASIQDTSTIDGGAGNKDRLKIADDSVDLTKVKNFEILDLTEGNHNVSLSAKDVLDMTDSNNRLRIDGDSGDNLGLASKGWVASGTTSEDGINYNVYTNTEGGKTVTLEVQNQVHVDI
ncbi:retention module-containing protein [Campylobacter concisus]|uniref:retention module-containing protein n=3 Tax=Campylobacter concisus TaxID=199 RepID=UPI000CD86796|nr:retention module-containing protein [Campylobacter concisus]